jgi:hypothetical protein
MTGDLNRYLTHPNPLIRLEMSILMGDDFDVYLALTDIEIGVSIRERLFWCPQCELGHLPDDPCQL